MSADTRATLFVMPSRGLIIPLLFWVSACSAHLVYHPVPPDGDCLFSAVALSVALTDGDAASSRARAVRTAAARLRADAMDELCPQGVPDPELVIGGVPASLLVEPLGGETEQNYCSRMRKPGQWGSTAEILALTRVLKRAIHVHASFGVQVYGADETMPAIAVHFKDHHYTAVTGDGATDTKQEL